MKRKLSRARVKHFIKDIYEYTPFVKMVFLLLILWFLFSAIIFIAENKSSGSTINSFGDALYWGVAAFTTAGIADKPVSDLAKIAGGLWLVIGSVLFFGAIVATVTTYFMKPLQRPHKKIIDTIEYNLEQLEELDVDELDLLKETVDTLIEHVERFKSLKKK
ncbi:MAG: ion channel [Draconibacterium sp.]|nr:ion channel [Draconibacterium sp.]